MTDTFPDAVPGGDEDGSPDEAGDSAVRDRRVLALYHRVVDNSPDIIYYLDNSGRVAWVNPSAFRFFGYDDPAGIIGQPFVNYIHPDDRELVLTSFLEAVRTHRENTTGLVFRLLKAGGDVVWVELHSQMIFDEDGNYFDEVGACRDISERRKAEDELNRVNAELRAYAQVVSHDIKTPLTAIQLALDMIRRLLDDEHSEEAMDQAREMVGVLDRNVEQANRLVSDLLTLAEAGLVPDDYSELDVTQLVHRVVEELAGSIEERGARVDFDADLGRVCANRTQLYQVFSNLVRNAVVHNDSPEPRVEISFLGVTADGGYHYRVKDNGSGIQEDYMDRVFDLFFKGTTGVTGLGLAIVRKIVDASGWDISVRNEGGASFELILYDRG
ncbi:MAG: PAS domain-containing sensor histidine kinase [Actinobacteria bacterium]|nr:PAS domain-containing sensor histidine kinase [Actinomycetota bacterium]MBU1943933.1 PAS domain-containing sensor histidine kinase [Actinomycetota bacterium]MBU2686979.1 PAS domain-containing sensor histidine kinase [Actinomycetota bacterium]